MKKHDAWVSYRDVEHNSNDRLLADRRVGTFSNRWIHGVDGRVVFAVVGLRGLVGGQDVLLLVDVAEEEILGAMLAKVRVKSIVG